MFVSHLSLVLKDAVEFTAGSLLAISDADSGHSLIGISLVIDNTEKVDSINVAGCLLAMDPSTACCQSQREKT